jgi:hypothetical protein
MEPHFISVGSFRLSLFNASTIKKAQGARLKAQGKKRKRIILKICVYPWLGEALRAKTAASP